MWDALNATTGSVLSWLPQTTGSILSWLPHNWVELGWCVSFGPPALCLLGVHLLFRNIFTILFFSVKVVISLIVYMHIRTLVSTAVHPYSFESVIFGVPAGTLHAPLTVGLQIIQAKTLIAVTSICPRCFPKSIPPPTPPYVSQSPWIDWMKDHSGL